MWKPCVQSKNLFKPRSREIFFQISRLLFSTWREYFFSQPTHLSSQPKKSGYKQCFSPFTRPWDLLLVLVKIYMDSGPRVVSSQTFCSVSVLFHVLIFCSKTSVPHPDGHGCLVYNEILWSLFIQSCEAMYREIF